jgi:predicted O-methyltransferase YrrM
MTSYLPEFHVANELRKARSLLDSAQRGWGLQFTDLKHKILADHLYNDAYDLAKDRTVVHEMNRMNMYLILRFFMLRIPFGHIVEYGTYLGGNAIFMAYVVKKLYPGMRVYALDTYEGMPATDKSIDMHSKGDFIEANYDSLLEYKNSLGLDNLVLVKGLFQDTNDHVMKDAKNIALAHIDCDVIDGVKYAYDHVKPHMVRGGYIVFDDATVSSCLGATEAVEDLVIRRDGLNSEQIWPHFVFRAFFDSTPKL